jgi:hypothetical protein
MNAKDQQFITELQAIISDRLMKDTTMVNFINQDSFKRNGISSAVERAMKMTIEDAVEATIRKMLN